MAKKISSLAHRRPVLFSTLVTLAFVVALILLTVVASAFREILLQEILGIVGRGLLALVAGAFLWRLGWKHRLRWPADRSAWRLSSLPLAYLLVVYPYLLTGGYGLHSSDHLLLVFVALNGLAAGVMEEVVFRGLVLESLLRRWGESRSALWRSLVVSSALFSAPHALNVLAGAEPLRTGAQLVWALLLGIVFGALVVAGGSLWPVAALHGIGNAVIHVNRQGAEPVTDSNTALLLALAPVPLLFYVWNLLSRAREGSGQDRVAR